ncbi:MAG TPA: CoA-binding protein [Clostridia bacterium]|nr:CoA-binding protein [Clostridia bacterium]
MEKLINEMLDQNKWAVVGASRNESKFGYRIYKLLKDRGYDTVPINPVYRDIDGDATKSDLLSLDEKVDCISVVVSPKRAKKVVKDAIETGIENIWFQPGTYNSEIINLAKEGNLNVVYDNCVLVELGKRD